MKINDRVFSLPPFISTSWGNVAALHMRETLLIVNLIDGETVQIPHLKPELLELIFNTHAKFLEEDFAHESINHQTFGMFTLQPFQEEAESQEIPLRFGIGAMDAWGTALQHNPAQANMISLPEEVLEKVRSISKIIAPEDPQAAPKPEPHCNCMHCQIARAINQGLGLSDMYKSHDNLKEIAAPVPEKDLIFQQWEIHQTADKTYSVINKLDADEKYNVFLNNPVRCSCEKPGCEHIIAVLKS